MSNPLVKFNVYNVQNVATKEKTRVFYSLDNHVKAKRCVTIYDRDYGRALGRIFQGVGGIYRNDTDMMTDYFDKGQVDIFENDPIYTAARAGAEAAIAKLKDKRAKRDAARASFDKVLSAQVLGQVRP